MEEDVAYRIMLWLKYFRYDFSSFDQIVESILTVYKTSIILDKKLFYQNVETLLLEKHQIVIISKSPLILRSLVPFKDLEEMYK